MVICDRFTDSTLAYQVYGKKVDINFINNIHQNIEWNKPNIVFILKVAEKISRARLKKKTKTVMIIFQNLLFKSTKIIS